MKRNRVYIWLEDGCLAWEIRTRTGSQIFGAGIESSPQGPVFRNFQWTTPVCATLREFLGRVADLSLVDTRGLSRRRMDVEKIKVKPWQEESYRRIVATLREEAA